MSQSCSPEVVVVTGASASVGRATARAFAAAVAAVVGLLGAALGALAGDPEGNADPEKERTCPRQARPASADAERFSRRRESVTDP